MSRPSPSKIVKESKQVVKSPNDESEEFITFVKVYTTKKMKKGIDIISLPMDDIMGVEQIVMLNYEDMEAVYNMDWATSCVVRVYMRYVSMY